MIAWDVLGIGVSAICAFAWIRDARALARVERENQVGFERLARRIDRLNRIANAAANLVCSATVSEDGFVYSPISRWHELTSALNDDVTETQPVTKETN